MTSMERDVEAMLVQLEKWRNLESRWSAATGMTIEQAEAKKKNGKPFTEQVHGPADVPSKTLLPFRAIRVPHIRYEMLQLEWWGTQWNPHAKTYKKIPYTTGTGNIEVWPDEMLDGKNPLGNRIYELMRMFWEMEAQLGPTTQERDLLKAKCDELAAQVKRLEASVAEHKRQVRDLKAK